MTEEIKQIQIYYYFANGTKIWTTNKLFAQIRAIHYGMGQIYVEVMDVKEEKN